MGKNLEELNNTEGILDNLYKAGDLLINPPPLEDFTEEDLNSFSLNFYMSENYKKDLDEAIEEYNKKGFISTG